MRGLEHLFGDALRPHAVAALDLVLVGALLAGQLAGHRLEAHELGAEPASPLRLEPSGVELLEQRDGVGDQLGGVARLLRLRLRRQLRGPKYASTSPSM
jgi:hypothetical protein